MLVMINYKSIRTSYQRKIIKILFLKLTDRNAGTITKNCLCIVGNSSSGIRESHI